MGKPGGQPGAWWNMLNPYERKRMSGPPDKQLMQRARTEMHCRTLKEMSEQEIRELEQEYGCPVIRPA